MRCLLHVLTTPLCRQLQEGPAHLVEAMVDLRPQLVLPLLA